jgi:4a-hydroxytetrahydrobiopterin dehydratase
MKLAEMNCVPCRGDDPKLTDAEIKVLMSQVSGWQVLTGEDIHRLEKRFRFKSYSQAVDFTTAVASLAEEQDHHPAILLEWRKVTVQWWTHIIKGLHQNDFISAAKTDAIYNQKFT